MNMPTGAVIEAADKAMIKTEIYHSLLEALRAAHYGILYAYVSPSLEEGWLSKAQLPDLQWYEKLVLLDRSQNREFLRQIGADDQYVFIAIGHGFVIFTANSPEELSKQDALTRSWMQ